MGLFTKHPIAPETLICEYGGDVFTTKDALRRPDKSYLMRLGPNVYVDALDDLTVLARYINDSRSRGRNNVKFLKYPRAGKAQVIASQSIQANTELYVDYGRWYWLAFSLRKC